MTFAETQKVTAIGEYTYGDRETREDAKLAALEDAKRNALEKVVVQVKSYSVIKKFKLVEDDVRSYTAGRLRITDRKFEFTGEKMNTCIATIVAVIDFDLNEIADSASRNTTVPKPNVPTNAAPTPVSDTGSLSEILNGAAEWNGRYYKIFPMPMSWENAEKFCESVGGHLAAPETRAENEMLKQLFLKYDKNVKKIRIGGYKEKNGLWHWVNGKWFANYFDWGNGQPRGERTLIFSRDIDGKWATVNDYGYASEYFFMCEWESAADAHDSTL